MHTVLIDHDNIPIGLCTPEAIIDPWLLHLEDSGKSPDQTEVYIRVRVYGGWYEGYSISKSRMDAIAHYQEKWPAIKRSTKNMVLRFSIEFADYLYNDDPKTYSEKITHTVAVRKSPPQLSLAENIQSCSENSCERNKIKRWIKKERGCPKQNCPHSFSDCFERKQQKQVDMHIAMDIAEICTNTKKCRHLAVISEDTDLIPAFLWSSKIKPADLSFAVMRQSGKPLYHDLPLRQSGIDFIGFAKGA